MYIGTLFWAIFLIIIIFRFLIYRDPNFRYAWGGDVIILVLLFLLGWAEFGFILQGGAGYHPLH